MGLIAKVELLFTMRLGENKEEDKVKEEDISNCKIVLNVSRY